MARFSFPSPGARGRDDAWFRLGTLDITTTLAIIGLTIISIVVWAVAPDALAVLALEPDAVRAGEVWRIVTWPLYNQPSLWTVIGLAFFYFFGRELERLMGRNRFLVYSLLLTVLPGLVGTALGVGKFGLDTLQLACFLAYVVLYPQARSFFNIPLWVLGAVFLGIEVLQLVGMRAFGLLVFQLSTYAVAIATLSVFGMTGAVSWLPTLKLPKRKPRRKLQVVATPPPPVFRPAAPGRPTDGLRQAEIDVLLDKIAAQGIDSLTAEERRRLDEASRRLRDDRD